MKRVPIGRVLPVFLAILFVGGAEQALQAANNTGEHSSCLAFERRSPEGAAYVNARTALCLLPAILSHACQNASQGLPGFSARSGGIAPGSETVVGLAEELDGAKPRHLLHVARLCQRPPPAA
jgi:hypothetical protein